MEKAFYDLVFGFIAINGLFFSEPEGSLGLPASARRWQAGVSLL